MSSLATITKILFPNIRGLVAISSKCGFNEVGVNFSTSSDQSETSSNELLEIDQRFQRVKLRNQRKEELIAAINLFNQTKGKEGGYIEFIENIMENLKNVDLHKDLDVYKSLLRVFPEGKLIPKNYWQAINIHFPVQQMCAINLLDQMEWFGVYPDKEVYDLMISRFGIDNLATNKIKRQFYWLPKLRHTNKYLDRRKVEGQYISELETAKLALKTICRDAGTEITFVKRKSDGKWILSAQSPLQKRIISRLNNDTICNVDGPYRVYVMDIPVNYVVLSSPPCIKSDEEFIDQRKIHDFDNLKTSLYETDQSPDTTIHHQSDMTVLSLAVLEQSTQLSASDWIEHLVSRNPKLAKMNVLFRIKEPLEIYPR